MPNSSWKLALLAVMLAFTSVTPSTTARSLARAGASHIIEGWDTEDGLPQNSVISIAQTRDGYLWLGTLNGLVRFDGSRFTVFDEVNTPQLNSSQIVYLFEDSHTNLWIGTETAGIALVRGGRVQNLDIGRGTREGRLIAACEDSTGAIWLYTADGQLCRYHEERVNVWRPGDQSASAYRAVVAESNGLVWAGSDHLLVGIAASTIAGAAALPIKTSSRVGKLDYLLASRQGGCWRLANGSAQKWKDGRIEQDLGPYPWGSERVSAACEDLDGNLVVSTFTSGLYWFGASGKAINLSTNDGLSQNIVLSLHTDREGNLWVGTDGGGLNRVKRPVFDVLEASRNLVVQTVAEDADGGLWIGFNRRGTGYWRDGEMKLYSVGHGLANPYVRAVFVDHTQHVWAGTFGIDKQPGLFEWSKSRFERVNVGKIAPVIFAIHEDRAKQLWLGTKKGLVCRGTNGWRLYTKNDGLSAEEVHAIMEDRDGNLWIGTVGGGLNRLRNGKFTAFRKEPDGLPSDDISSLYLDADGVLWIGTFGSGLARFQQGRWTVYTMRDGLLSNSAGYLLEDGQGFFWIGSNAGLMRIPKKALDDFATGATNFIPCRSYGRSDGLPNNECTLGSQPGACRSRTGRLWFPTIQGLVSVDPALLKPNPHAPPVIIETVLIDGVVQNTNALDIAWSHAVTLPANKERIEIEFTSLNLEAPERAHFKYRLEGHETTWIEAGGSRVARYSKLPPGSYTFRVTACNEDWVWNETGSTLTITVEPPFWKTWWFLSALVVGILGIITAVVHTISTQKLKRQVEGMRQKETLERERARIARDLHDQLGASLTQVSLLGELTEADKESPADVEQHAQQISKTSRDITRVLDEIVWAVNPSNDTLDGLITYICKYAQDYLAVAGLRYRLDAPPELPTTPIPPDMRHNVFLAAKEAITNVVRHAQASEVRLRLRLDPGSFMVEIEDNGRGVEGLDPQAPRTRNGLKNMFKRMEEIGGSFSITPGTDGGARVRLTAPLKPGAAPH